jgi:hypothetical protein
MPFSPQNSQALALGAFLLQNYANMNANLLYHDIEVLKSCPKRFLSIMHSPCNVLIDEHARESHLDHGLFVPVRMLKATIAVAGLLILQPAGFSHDCTKYYNNVS